MPKTSNNLLRFLPQLFLAGLVLLCGVWRHPGRPGWAADLAAAPRSGYTDSSYAPAALVLGAPDFTTHAGAGSGPAGMSAPSFIAVDPATGKVFVADERNNRVLRFARFAALANGAAAEAVFGQPDFSSHAAAAGPGGMAGPGGLAVDAAGRLWVAEWDNHRILRFDHAASRPSGAPADGVLGQPDFSANQPGGGPQHLTGPAGLAVDAAGRLWVADCYNSRVLRFEAAAAKPNGAPADGVLGQPDLATKEYVVDARHLDGPTGLALDAAGRLWVADWGNQRVLRFEAAADKPNGAPADGVLGQPDFTTHGPNIDQENWLLTASGLADPTGVAVDPAGRLWVVEQMQNRILRFEAAAAKPNGAPADGVLGQPDFSSPVGPDCNDPSAREVCYPFSLFFDPARQVLWVADGIFDRVLAFADPRPPVVVYLPLVIR